MVPAWLQIRNLISWSPDISARAVETGSFAALHEEDGRWIVRQSGPDPLWDAVEEHLGRWHAAGTPAVEEATVRVTPEGQSIHW
jgi:hypothetical protein